MIEISQSFSIFFSLFKLEISIKYLFKGYLPYKTILCNKVALDVWLMNFFTWRKNVSFSRYLDFCDFVESKDFKISDVIIGIDI